MADDPRTRIVAAAARLLELGGEDALSTRAVSAAAGVGAPTIYRVFGDKQGLLDAVAASGFETYLATKASRSESGDPVADLRAGWDAHIALACERPALYALMYGRPRGDGPSPAADAARSMLAALVRRIAAAGRLRMGEQRAAAMVHAAGSGVALSLIALAPDHRDPGLSAASREAVIAAITTDAPPADPGPLAAAVTLRAALDELHGFTAAERALLGEWLERATVGHAQPLGARLPRAIPSGARGGRGGPPGREER